MIECFEGRLGGGKTYSATARMVAHLARGGTVCTNIRLKWETIRAFVVERYGVEVEEDQLIILSNDKIGRFHTHVPWGSLRGSAEQCRVLVVVDEAHLYFNSRDWSQSDREMLAFLTQSDKVSVDVIFISQSVLNMDKQFMRITQYIWRFRDMEKYQVPGLGIAWPSVAPVITLVTFGLLGVFTGREILACKFDYDGKTLMDRRFVQKEKAIFGLYETAAMLTEFPEVPQAKTRTLKKATKTKNSMAKILLPVALIIGAVSVFFLVSKVRGATQDKPETVSPSAAPGSKSPLIVGGKKDGDRKTQTAYDVYAEEFRGYYGADRALRTSSGWYQLGEMSERGYVVAVSERRAKLEQPDGRTGWIVATSQPDLPKDARQTFTDLDAKPGEEVKEIKKAEPVGAKWEPNRSEWIEADEKRMDADRRRPIGNFRTH